jgi:hypothetical protein
LNTIALALGAERTRDELIPFLDGKLVLARHAVCDWTNNICRVC